MKSRGSIQRFDDVHVFAAGGYPLFMDHGAEPVSSARGQLLGGKLLVRNPLLEPRVWILELIFENFGGPFWLIFIHSGPSRRQTSILDDLTDLGTQNESSGACLRPDFGHFRQKWERFLKNCNFKVKKSTLEALRFLSCLLYTSPSPRDQRGSRMPSSA